MYMVFTKKYFGYFFVLLGFIREDLTEERVLRKVLVGCLRGRSQGRGGSHGRYPSLVVSLLQEDISEL